MERIEELEKELENTKAINARYAETIDDQNNQLSEFESHLEEQRLSIKDVVEVHANEKIEWQAEINSLNQAYVKLENVLDYAKSEVEDKAYDLGRIPWSV